MPKVPKVPKAPKKPKVPKEPKKPKAPKEPEQPKRKQAAGGGMVRAFRSRLSHIKTCGVTAIRLQGCKASMDVRAH